MLDSRQMAVFQLILMLAIVPWTKASANLDRGTLYFPAGKPFDLRCQNKTGGNFATVFWYGTPYTNHTIRTDIYRYDNTEKTYISPYFENRIVRNGTSLRILKSRITDSGKWKCDIVYGIDNDLKVATLASYTVHIISPPDLLDLSTSLLVLGAGQKISVFCESQANSQFNITWYKDNGFLTSHVTPGEIQQKVVPGQRPYITYIKRTYLDFDNITERDVGRYICLAKNLGGNVTQSMEVRIKKPPVIISRTSFEIDVKVSGALECKAKGYPQMDFTWEINPGTSRAFPISQGQSMDDFTVTRTTYDSLSEVGVSLLRISNVKKSYHGKYRCIASTADSKAEKDIVLSGKAPPDPPSIFYEQAEIAEHNIKLFWQLGDNGGAPITSVRIEHKNSSEIKGWFSIEVNKAITSYSIQNLEKGTTYDFRIQAFNTKGPSDYSQIATLSTKGAEVITVQPSIDADSDQILGSLDMTAMIGIFGGAFIALVVGFICVCIFVRKMQKGDKEEPVPPPHSMASYAPNHSATIPLTMVDGHAAAMEMEPLNNLLQPDEWEFPRERLAITTVLGAGAFGVVMRGLAQGIKGSVGQVTVAVKTVRDTTNEAATKDLVAELNLLKLIPEHQNVVGLLGCCSYADPLYVIVEYCSNGDLQGFLRSSRGIYERYYRTSYGGAVPDLTCKMLLTFAWQIAKGMNHLSSMKVIHRDLAARNILVDDQLVCKVSDFGFARDIYVEDHYLKRSAGGRFPIKWMAIESLLDGISTTKSDVWSFGVVLWELVTLGASPYPGMNSYEVVSFLQDGYRMDKPKHCSDEVYQLMMDCWCVAPGRRPSFMDLINRCQILMEECEHKELIDMNFYPDHLYVNFDGSSSAMSSSTTPHGTLTRNLVNNVKLNNEQYPNGSINNMNTPRSKTRSSSQQSMPTGRTSSVAALSERSVTGASTTSAYHVGGHPSERVALLNSTSRP